MKFNEKEKKNTSSVYFYVSFNFQFCIYQQQIYFFFAKKNNKDKNPKLKKISFID